MTKVFSTLVLSVALCSSANAGPKEEALQVLKNWTTAFSNSDVDGIVRLYAPDAHFIGTGSKTVVLSQDEIRKYFEQALLSNRPRTAQITDQFVTVLSESAVIVAALDTVTGMRNGALFSAQGRVTFVITKRGPDWRIVHFHRSAMPN